MMVDIGSLEFTIWYGDSRDSIFSLFIPYGDTIRVLYDSDYNT